MDPLRSDPRPAEALSGIERDGLIEQLLLAGLDEYFAHRYEHAVNLWTRVLFLDRHHDRARAYIERARRAQAERQRESDAALHQGMAAFHEGDVARARELVAGALDLGASADEAHGMLERIERLGAGRSTPRHRRRRPLAATAMESPALSPQTKPGPRHHLSLAATLLAAALTALAAIGTYTLFAPTSWPVISAVAERAPRAVAPIVSEPLPIPGASDTHIARARALLLTGRLRDALSQLERVPIGDPLWPEAERLRADVQRRLLTLVLVP